jgi:hypothetical protein
MKLYEVMVLDDSDFINYLTVSDKTAKELEEEIEKNNTYSCFIDCWVNEIDEVDGYKIQAVKI